MRSSLLVIVLPLVGAIPRGPPGERDTKTSVSKRGWSYHDVWDGNYKQPDRESKWKTSNWNPSNWWDWPGSGDDKPGNGKPDNDWPGNDWPGNDQPDDGQGDDSCEPDDDDDTPPPPQDPTPTKPPTQPSPTATQDPQPPSGDEPAYMQLVNKWMDGCNLRHFKHDSLLENNAFKTSEKANGRLQHHMFEGTMGQVMAMGDMSKFESCFVGGWLCEVPSLLTDPKSCDQYGAGWNHGGQTGHAEILSDKKYTKIGCKDYNNILTCDVA
ncbi:hypothetical protein MAJ_09461, partial [Metarhizium majus ARSEF 297]